MTRFSTGLLLFASAMLTACGNPIAVTGEDCGLEPGSTCLCVDGTYKPLVCAEDGSIYCECTTKTPMLVAPDASPDLDASLDMFVDMAVDMPHTSDADMALDASPDQDMPADMPDLSLEDMPDLSLQDMPDMDPCARPGGCEPVDCDLLLGNQALPAQWSQDTIGYLPDDLPAEYGWANGQLCMRAAGDDIWEKSDRFFFASTAISGDFDLSVKVDDFDTSEPFSKLGIMFRSAQDADAPFVMLQLNESQGASLLARHTANADATALPAHIAEQAPLWLRLIRRGDAFYGYTSSDGQSWKPINGFATRNIPTTGRLGLAISSHNPTLLSTASFSQFDLQTPPTPQEQCPANIACEEVSTYRGIDLASKGGLDPNQFLLGNVMTYQVTLATGEAPGTLHHALDQANIRSRSNLYTIIEVDTTQVTTPIEARSYMPPANNVWIKGNGATLQSPPNTSYDLLRVNEKVIVEGFHFRRGRHALFMDNSGNASSRLRSGVWIHHNSFEECHETCIDLPLTFSAERHVTIAYNSFGLEAASSGLDAINATNDCNINMATCISDERNLRLSIHHNLFGPKVTGGYPRGGAQTLFYDNHIEALYAPGIDLNTQGRILSRNNVFRGVQNAASVDVFTGGLNVDSRSDFFLDGATRNVSSSQSPASMYPDYFTFHFLSRDLLVDELSTATGP